MQEHLDPDRLILLALSEDAPNVAETAHLAGCAPCRVEIGSLRHVADLGRQAQDLGELPAPPGRVWEGIAAEVALADGGQPAARPSPAQRDPARRRLRDRRWAAPLLAAVVAAVVAIAGTVAAVQLLQRKPAVTAHADLAPLTLAPATAQGEAEILADDHLRLDVRNLPLTMGYYQVWLMNPDDLTQMVPVGILNAMPDVTVLPIAPTTDLNRYRLIDISAQLYGGDGAHSGKSFLRGTLTN